MTHTKTPHKHRDMMRAYIDDTSLCAFIKLTPHEKWKVVDEPAFLVQCEYFICLPKHKDAVLNLLNGGESEAKGPFSYWLDASSTHPAFSNETPQWFVDHWYMLDDFESRIKPKKVKRWVAVKGKTCSDLYESRHQLEAIYGKDSSVQFIEIETQA